MRLFYTCILAILPSCSSGDYRAKEKSAPDSVSAGISSSVSDPEIDDTVAQFFLPEFKGDSIACLIFFDPQGNGSVPVSLYKSLAYRHGIMLVGSNRSRNGITYPETRQIANHLLDEIRNRYGSRFKHISYYLAGFSGGAKVAFDFAVTCADPNLKALVYAGAPSAGEIPPIPLFGFAGIKDMNLADLVRFDQTIPETHVHILRRWEGKHEWPQADAFESVFQWISVRESQQPQKKKDLIQRAFHKAGREKDPLKAEESLLEARFFSKDMGMPDMASDKLIQLRQTQEWEKVNNALLAENQTELAIKDQYSRSFFQNDLAWWKSEIEDLHAHRKTIPVAMQDRLLGFISLASYSLAHRAMQKHEEEFTWKILEMYRMADPLNPEQAYLHAVFYAGKNQEDSSMVSLKRAISMGFKDRTRIFQQSEFQIFKDSPGFQELLSAL